LKDQLHGLFRSFTNDYRFVDCSNNIGGGNVYIMDSRTEILKHCLFFKNGRCKKTAIECKEKCHNFIDSLSDLFVEETDVL